MRGYKMKDGFIWGVAASAYQIEGTDPEDGRGECIWDVYAREGHCFEGQDARVACDHMHRYRDDYKLMAEYGVKAYRFSMSWARLIPDGTGKVNDKAVELYRDMIECMIENGIKPFITLYHWELPQALQEKGGWLNPEIVEAFGYYAKVVAENFSDLVTEYMTLNEPQCFTGLGYLSGVHAPGLKLAYSDTFKVTINALKAHGRAVQMLRQYSRQDIKIGYAPTCGVAIPATNSPEDIEAARKVYFGFENPIDNWTWNVSWFSDPVFLGKFPEEALEKYKEYIPEITQEDLDLIHQPLDFMGQNIYNGYLVKAGADGKPEFVNRKKGLSKTAIGWPVVPECIYWGVKFMYERYNMPIIITENGMSCHDVVSLDGKVHDPNRIDFLHRYLLELKKAIDEGVNVSGYFEWTFLDNFEWTCGYNDRFGLVYVDYETQERIPKDSAKWYKEVMETNGACL